MDYRLKRTLLYLRQKIDILVDLVFALKELRILAQGKAFMPLEFTERN